MTSALIGNTGFVGGNLRRQVRFDVLVSSSNVDELRGRSFELVACAGADQPHMEAAIDFLQRALHELQVAEPNKGGHRANAIALTKQAIDEANAGMAYADD